jgi:5-methylcytosine-specific restriction protein A
MKAYLLTWNPKYWAWENIDEEINKLQKNEFVETQWDCSSKQPEEGDIFFIIAIGISKQKGIFCSGFVNELLENMPSLIDKKKKTNRIMGNVNLLLNPNKDNILGINYLNEIFPDQTWSPQNCGIIIKEKYTNDLINLWKNIVGEKIDVKEKLKSKEFWEGNSQQKLYTVFERNIDARDECINNYGYSCKVCGINLEDVYGEIGKNFIHVHHITFHSTLRKAHKIDPKNDLTTVCPNCHSMLHRRINGKYLTIEELQKCLNKP